MPVLRMTVPCFIYKYEGSTGFGAPKYAETPIKTVCSIVDTDYDDNKTTVRTDSSATKGNAREATYDTRLLIPKHIKVDLMDKVIADGQDMKIVRISPRRNVFGRLDHIEIRCDHAKL